MTNKITQKELKDILEYDKTTGLFTRLKRTNNKQVLGGIVGSLSHYGYVLTKINNISYSMHRLAWLYVYGAFPERHLDHINGIRDDNRISNLREVDIQANNENRRKAQKNNAIGFLGVHISKGKYEASIRIKGKSKNLGRYTTPELAHEAYLAAKRKLHAGCTI